MNKNVFELVEVSKDQAIIKVNAKDALTVARHPYLSSEYEYITLTRGDNHILTVIKDNGKTFSFHFGRGGYTLISESLEQLKFKVLEFLRDNKVLMDVNFDKAKSASIFYNDIFESWQLNLYDNEQRFGNQQIVWLKDCNDVDGAIEKAKPYGIGNFKRGTCQTGIPIWYGERLEEHK